MKPMRWLIFLLIITFSSIEISPAAALPNPNSSKKGLALTGSQPIDVDRLEADWWYVYSVWDEYLYDSRYVPMLYEGVPNSNIPRNWPGYILVFNEPSRQGIDPFEAASRYLGLFDYYFEAKLVVGGIVEAQIDWTQEFLSYLPVTKYPSTWHIHHYFSHEINQAILDIKRFYELTGTPIWVTEFGSVSSDIHITSGFITWLENQPWIHRYAYFPTRMNKEYSWFPQSWDNDMALIDWDTGDLKPMGKMYKDFNLTQVFIPLVK